MLTNLKFKKYYYQEREFIRSTIYWMVRSDITDDLVQETFIKAWNNFDNFNKKSSFRTWIYRIAMNTTYDYLRKKKIDSSIGDKQISADYQDPKNSEQKMIMKDLIDFAMGELDENSKEVFILFYKMEYTISDIAKLLGIPEGTVKSRLHSSKEKFQRILEKHGVTNE